MTNQSEMRAPTEGGRVPLRQLSDVIRSKNAGPYRITLDIFFKDHEGFTRAIKSGEITPAKVAALYKIQESDVISFVPVESVYALKVTIRRQSSCGAFEDTDIYGAQQHVPLLSISIPKVV